MDSTNDRYMKSVIDALFMYVSYSKVPLIKPFMMLLLAI